MAELTRYRKRRSSVGSEYEMEDVLEKEPQEPQQPQEHVIQIEQGGGEVRECKLCGDNDPNNFIDGQVCQCSGSMAYMCYDYMRGIITHINTYPKADDGWPLCRECGGRFRLVDMGMSFGEYLQLTSGFSLARALGMIIVPVILLALLIMAAIVVDVLASYAPFVGVVWAFALFLVAVFLIFIIHYLVTQYHNYQTSPATVLYGVPPESEPKIQDTYL